jgi:hypothetical protein
MSDLSQSQRRDLASEGRALPGGRFPIRNCTDLNKAVHAVGRVRPNTEEARAKVRRFIIRRARALGCTSGVPDTWNSDGTLKS